MDRPNPRDHRPRPGALSPEQLKAVVGGTGSPRRMEMTPEHAAAASVGGEPKLPAQGGKGDAVQIKGEPTTCSSGQHHTFELHSQKAASKNTATGLDPSAFKDAAASSIGGTAAHGPQVSSKTGPHPDADVRLHGSLLDQAGNTAPVTTAGKGFFGKLPV